MATKQNRGAQAPDSSQYVTLTDGAGNLGTTLGSGDVQIGAVELKNATDDTRATITADNALKVDGSAARQVSTASLTSLASAATSAQLLAANSARKGLVLTNTDANGVYVKYGTTASATSFTVLIPANGYWEMPLPTYTGRIDAIWAADGSGSLYATEL